MMIFGFLFLLVVVAILVVGGIAVLVWLNRNNRQGNLFSISQPSEKQEQITGPDAKHFCAHCGAGLQEGWTHCPQCGAPVGP